jgi:hypothetical protein
LTREVWLALNRLTMDTAPWVRVTLGPSRIAGAAVVLVFTATAVLAAWLPWPHSVRAVMVLALGAYAIVLARSWATRSTGHAVVAAAVGIDRRISLTEANGERVEGVVHADSYVGSMLTTIVVRLPARRRLRTVAILPDMLPAEDLRRLRVLLRLGRDDDSADGTALPREAGRGERSDPQ